MILFYKLNCRTRIVLQSKFKINHVQLVITHNEQNKIIAVAWRGLVATIVHAIRD